MSVPDNTGPSSVSVPQGGCHGRGRSANALVRKGLSLPELESGHRFEYSTAVEWRGASEIAVDSGWALSRRRGQPWHDRFWPTLRATQLPAFRESSRARLTALARDGSRGESDAWGPGMFVPKHDHRR